jgi:Protein of unknown function (DUF3011)
MRKHMSKGEAHMVRKIIGWAFALAVLAASAPAAMAAQGFLTCESQGYRYQYCNANTQGRVLIMREVSTGNLCRQGSGWGFDNNGIWVDRGCRAEFSYGRGDDGGGGGGWGRSGTLTCNSDGYRYSYCNADTQGRVSLLREYSTGNLCRQGSGWGYDNGGIWVDRGCRGEFRYGRDSGGRNDAAIAAGILGAFAIGAAVASSQNNPQPPPQPVPPPPSPATRGTLPPAWAIGAYQAYDPDSGDIVQLVVSGGGRVYLRNETGELISEGGLRDGMVYWGNGKKSWFAREGPGVLVGDVDTGKHFYFRRNG